MEVYINEIRVFAFHKKTGALITMKLFYLFYTGVGRLKATWNGHVYFGKRMEAVQNPDL